MWAAMALATKYRLRTSIDDARRALSIDGYGHGGENGEYSEKLTRCRLWVMWWRSLFGGGTGRQNDGGAENHHAPGCNGSPGYAWLPGRCICCAVHFTTRRVQAKRIAGTGQPNRGWSCVPRPCSTDRHVVLGFRQQSYRR